MELNVASKTLKKQKYKAVVLLLAFLLFSNMALSISVKYLKRIVNQFIFSY